MDLKAWCPSYPFIMPFKYGLQLHLLLLGAHVGLQQLGCSSNIWLHFSSSSSLKKSTNTQLQASYLMPSESFWANFLLQHVFFFWSSFWIKRKTGKLHLHNKKQQMFDSKWFLLTIFDFSTLCVLAFSHMLGQMAFCELYGDMCTTEQTNMISVR